MEVGGTGPKFGKVDDKYACAQACRDHDKCEAFMFVGEGFTNLAYEKDCFLRWTDLPANPYFTFDKITGGYKNCRNTYTTIDSKYCHVVNW